MDWRYLIFPGLPELSVVPAQSGRQLVAGSVGQRGADVAGVFAGPSVDCPQLLECLGIRFAGEIEANGDRRCRARREALEVAVLRPHARADVLPTPHQHLCETVAETANRNRNVYPIRLYGNLTSAALLLGVLSALRLMPTIETRPAASGRCER
jgi:hypothetical protein